MSNQKDSSVFLSQRSWMIRSWIRIITVHHQRPLLFSFPLRGKFHEKNIVSRVHPRMLTPAYSRVVFPQVLSKGSISMDGKVPIILILHLVKRLGGDNNADLHTSITPLERDAPSCYLLLGYKQGEFAPLFHSSGNRASSLQLKLENSRGR